MSTVAQDGLVRIKVREKLIMELTMSGLLEYVCEDAKCRTQIFTTWEVDLDCRRCGKKVKSVYYV